MRDPRNWVRPVGRRRGRAPPRAPALVVLRVRSQHRKQQQARPGRGELAERTVRDAADEARKLKRRS